MSLDHEHDHHSDDVALPPVAMLRMSESASPHSPSPPQQQDDRPSEQPMAPTDHEHAVRKPRAHHRHDKDNEQNDHDSGRKPKPHKMSKHDKRDQLPMDTPAVSLSLARHAVLSLLLLAGSFFAFIMLASALTALIYDVWLEEPTDEPEVVTRVHGRSATQTVLMVVAVCVGGPGLIGLALVLLTAEKRMLSINSTWAVWSKIASIVAAVVVTGLSLAHPNTDAQGAKWGVFSSTNCLSFFCHVLRFVP